MKIKRVSNFILIVVIVSSIMLSACSSAFANPAATATPGPTATLDLCAPDNIKNAASAVHRLTRTFDDTANIAVNTSRDKLSAPVSALQAVRRQAEDLRVPDCLVNLKNLQLSHMNAVISTMVAFMGGATSDTLNKGIALARTQRKTYDDELSRLLGATLTPAPTLPELPTSIPPTPTP
jgi:hypothetical protein